MCSPPICTGPTGTLPTPDVPSPLHRLFLHFFDLHFLHTVAGNSDPQHVRAEVRLATRLAVLVADEVLIPAASYFESQLCSETIDELAPLFPAGHIRMVGGDDSPKDFILAKLETYDEGGTQHTRYAASLETGNFFPPFQTRTRSATEDITQAWLDRGSAPDFIDRQFGRHAPMLPSTFMEAWLAVPERLGFRAFTPDYVSPLLADGVVYSLVEKKVRRFINSEYFLSYSTELGAGFVTDMTVLRSPYNFDNRFGNLRFDDARRRLQGAGLLETIATADAAQLRALKDDENVAKALLPTIGPSSAGIQPSGRVKLDIAVDLTHEVETLRKTPRGDRAASTYQKRVASILDQVFGHSLGSSQLETPINQGRKRLDITWVNQAAFGVFHWLAISHTAPFILGECKNYTKDIANTELDQLIGRFSPYRGRVGLLLYRSVTNRALLIRRCIDAFQHGQGLILAFDDDDIAKLAGMDHNAAWDGEQSQFLTERVIEVTRS